MIQTLSSSWSFWLFWFIAFIGFPIGGLVANLVVGGVTDLPKALLAGAITGLAVGGSQWLALCSRYSPPRLVDCRDGGRYGSWAGNQRPRYR